MTKDQSSSLSESTSTLSASRHMMTPVKKSKPSTSTQNLAGAGANQPSAMIDRPDPQVLFSPSGKSTLKREDMIKRYDEWLKIASENKLTAKNTWNVALIDYFSDMSIIKDAENGQINFQKASCTLDGCVKIYTSRIDSVVDEAGKLLHGLADAQNDGKGDNAGENFVTSNDEFKLTKRKGARTVSDTLAKTSESLNIKSVEDVAFQVDPLFREMCYAFDEGASRGHGGTGWLLGHLRMSMEGALLLDTSEEAIDLFSKLGDSTQMDTRLKVDVSLREAILQGEPMAEKTRDLLEKLQISASQSKQQESMDQVHEMDLDNGWEDFGGVEDEDADEARPSTLPSNPLTAALLQNLENLDTKRQKELGGTFESHSLSSEATIDGQNVGYPNGGYLNESYLIEGFASSSPQDMDVLVPTFVTGESILPFRYFEKSWAGPEHWKVSQVQSYRRAVGEAKKKERKTKVDNKFDFTDAPEIDIRTLFLKPTNMQTLTMTLDIPEESECEGVLGVHWPTCLPEDLGIRASTVLLYFTKPRVSILSSTKKLIGKKGAFKDSTAGREAQAMAILRAPEAYIDTREDDVGHDDGGFDEGGNDMMEEVENLVTETSVTISSTETPLIRPQFLQKATIGYSNVAKSIDVGQLKKSMLDTLKLSAKTKSSGKNIGSNTCQTLGTLISKVPESIISNDERAKVAFGFMALLHLANEHQLTLRNTNNYNDILIIE